MIYSAPGARRVAFDVEGAAGHAAGHQVAALQAGDGAAILLVPGFTGSKEDFAPIIEPLADAGFAVTAIDQPGQFESPGPADAAAYTPDRLARAVLAVAAALPGPVRLLGHSFGGLVARAAVIASASSFDSLVLLSSGPADLGGVRRVRMNDFEPVLATGGMPGVYAAMQAAAAEEPGFAPPPEEVERFLERRFLHGSPQMLQGMADALRAEPDRVGELAATGVRTLVVHGVDDDAWPPAEQQDMARRLGARYEVIAGAAHSAAEQNPAALVEVLVDFWR